MKGAWLRAAALLAARAGRCRGEPAGGRHAAVARAESSARSRIRTRPGVLATIVWQLRLPRVCIAATVGASLALCGAMLQGMLRNPLVDPYLTGVSAGAAAAIAVAILAGAAATGDCRRSGFVAGLGRGAARRRARAARQRHRRQPA